MPSVCGFTFFQFPTKKAMLLPIVPPFDGAEDGAKAGVAGTDWVAATVSACAAVAGAASFVAVVFADGDAELDALATIGGVAGVEG